jgi:hypothetical protein
MQDKIPSIKKRPATVHVHLFAVVHKRGSLYLMQSADGMWEFPTFAELPEGEFKRVGECKHTITNHRLDISVYTGKVQGTYEWKDVDSVPISSLTQKIKKTADDADCTD